MLSKCANPECPKIFRYLYQGKIFHLDPTPEVQAVPGVSSVLLHERFWLCDQCSKEMTLLWGGTQVKLVRLPIEIDSSAGTPATPGASERLDEEDVREPSRIGRTRRSMTMVLQGRCL